MKKLASEKIFNTYYEKVIIVFLLVLAAFNYFSQSSDQYKYFNSDALTIYAFVDDIFNFSGSVKSWHFSNAPGFFPDYIIAFVTRLFTTSVYLQIFCASLIQVGVVYFLVKKLASPLIGEQSKSYALMITLSLLNFANADVSPYFQMLIINWHFGTYLMGLFYLAVYNKIIVNDDVSQKMYLYGANLWFATVLCALSFVMTVSDSLFAIVFSGPIFLIGCYEFSRHRLSLKIFGVLFSLPFFSSLVGYILAPLIIPNFNQIPFHLNSVSNLLPKFLEVLNLVYQVGFAGILISIFIIILLQALFKNTSKITKEGVNEKGSDKMRGFLTWFVFLSLSANLIIVIASNALVADRYLPTLFFTPFVFLFLLSPSIFQIKWLIKSVIFLLFIVFANHSWSSRAIILKSDYYPEQIACIDNATKNLADPSGIGEYWLTKKLVAFSKNGVRMVSVNPDLSPYAVLISDQWFKNNYNFAVINTAEPEGSMYLLNQRLIENYNGKPDRVAFCKDAKILIYEHGLSTVMDPVRGTGVYSMDGCKLPRSTGEVSNSDSCSLKNSNLNYNGNLSYGPYFKLPAGRYEYDISYASPNPENLKIGHFDISFLLPENHKIISEKDLLGSAGEGIHSKGILEIDQSLARGQLEIRTFIESNVKIEIFSISVVRMK